MRQLGRVAGSLRSDHGGQQRIIPDITFTCSGTVTKWIVSAGNPPSDADKLPDRLPEVQFWRKSATGSEIYTKIHGMTLLFGVESGPQIYEYNISAVDVQPGDILGTFEPDASSLRLYYTDQYGPGNYYKITTSTAFNGDFNVAGVDGSTNDMPLVTVEISKLIP